MNIVYDIEILKAMFSETSRSRYMLEKELSKSRKNVNYSTLRRRIFELSNEGYVCLEPVMRKNGECDQRKTGKPTLTFKGLVFLVLNASLDESETRAIVQKILSKSACKNTKIDTTASNIGTACIQETIEQIKPKVNLEYYDEEYVRNLWLDTFVENILEEVLSYWKDHMPPEQERERYVKKAKKDLSRLPHDTIKIAFVAYEHLKSKRDYYSNEVNLLKPFIKVFEKSGVKP